MDVYTYFNQREAECRDLSLVPDTSFEEMFAEEEGSDGSRGIMWGRLTLTETAFLNVLETVEVVGSGIHRERYSYYLIIDGLEVWGYDRDPDHDPAEHMHIGDRHHRHDAGRVTFRDVATKAWETVSQESEWASVPPANPT